MGEKYKIEKIPFDCSRCGRVIFTAQMALAYADEIATPIASTIDKFLDYGACQVAQEAGGHPILSEAEKCPFLNKHR